MTRSLAPALLAISLTAAPAKTMPAEKLDDSQVAAFAKLALEGVTREFPNKPMHVHTDPGSAQRPRDLHPVFYGCFDWH